MRSSTSPTIVREDDYVGGPTLSSGWGSDDQLTVRRVRIDAADPDVAAVWGDRPGYVGRVFLAATPPCTLYQSEAALAVPSRRVAETAFREVGAGYLWPILNPIDVIKFELPESALARWSHDDRRFGRRRLNLKSDVSVLDNVFLDFGRSALRCLDEVEAASQFFVDHLLDGICAYTFVAFGDRSVAGARGGLAPWQVGRAKSLIESRIRSDLTLEELARECGLSVAHFTRGFRQAVGASPHQWLMRCRTERARWLLLHTEKPLADIAADCGFFDQSHFTNVFRRRTGASPGVFRREQNIGRRPRGRR